MAEMKLELDLLLMRDPRKLFKEDECKNNNILSHIIRSSTKLFLK